MSISIKWDITYKCNLFCDHCINGNSLSNTNTEPSLEETKQIINHLSEKNIDYIHLLGGEPTMQQNFIEILNYFNEKNIPFGFNTNGLLLGHNNMIHDIAHLKCFRNIVFSIEAPIAEINDSIRGKAVFEKTISNVEKMVRYKKENDLQHFHITINMVLCQTNKDYLIPMIKYCVALGVDELCLLQLIAQGNAQDKNISLTFDDELKLVKEIADIYSSVKDVIRIVPRFVRPMAIDYANKVLGKEFPSIEHGCGAGTKFAYITNQGMLYPCDRYQQAVIEKCDNPKALSLIDNSFDEIWKLDGFGDIFSCISHEDFCQEVVPCNNCAYLKETCYPCPVNMIGGTKKAKEISCIQYSKLIREHVIQKNNKLSVTNYTIREVHSDDELYTLFHTETFETLALNKEAYLIWNELKNLETLQYNDIVALINSKYHLANADIREILNTLIDFDYLEAV